ARHQIIHRHHSMPLGDQAVGHMTANKTGSPGDQNSHFCSLLVKTERKRDGGKERWRERAVISTPLDPSFSLSLHLSLFLHLPIPRFLNPASSTACGSKRLRPSTSTFWFIISPI